LLIVLSLHYTNFVGLDILEELNLKNNAIIMLEPHCLYGLHRLKILNLSSNKLRELDFSHIAGAESLLELDLSKNELQVIFLYIFKL
jgi:Leucine-rich repeat (LRR) protein